MDACRLGKHPVTRSLLTVQVANSVSVYGVVASTHVTPNGQHAFFKVKRRRWVLESMERVKDFCDRLARPSDPLRTFCRTNQRRPECTQLGDLLSQCPSARYPSPADFMMTASACLPGAHCPSFNREIITKLPNGFFSKFSFDLRPCPEGQFCIAGHAVPCLSGFTCPARGLTAPVRCDEEEGGWNV